MLLRSCGYEVLVAKNGAEALAELAQRPRVDAVVLDLMMPVMNGYEFRAAQLADDRIASIPVVVCSATAESHPALRASEMLRKPIDFDELLDTLDRVLAHG